MKHRENMCVRGPLKAHRASASSTDRWKWKDGDIEEDFIDFDERYIIAADTYKTVADGRSRARGGEHGIVLIVSS